MVSCATFFPELFIEFLRYFLVKFEIGGGDPKTPTNEQDEAQEETWECVWKCHTAAPVHHMAFSPDGTLFATSGKSDRLVKVWYENKHCKLK
jgi:DmX-like protein